MCGRAVLIHPKKAIEKRFKVKFSALDEEANVLNYNVAPTQMHPVITNDNPEQAQMFRWGLIPFWAKDKKIGSKMINARVETIDSKPSFRNAIKKRRCLIPFSGFYEWKKVEGKKAPFYIYLKNKELFSMAGIWEKWKDPETEKNVYSFSIITQDPNEFMADIHNRMPAILLPDQEQEWLNNDRSVEDALSLIHPIDSSLMEAYQVSTRVNRPTENDADLLTPVGETISF